MDQEFETEDIKTDNVKSEGMDATYELLLQTGNQAIQPNAGQDPIVICPLSDQSLDDHIDRDTPTFQTEVKAEPDRWYLRISDVGVEEESVLEIERGILPIVHLVEHNVVWRF